MSVAVMLPARLTTVRVRKSGRLDGASRDAHFPATSRPPMDARGENHFTVLRSFAASVLQRFGVGAGRKGKEPPRGRPFFPSGSPPLPCPQRGLWPPNAEELGLIAQAQVQSHTPRRGI